MPQINVGFAKTCRSELRPGSLQLFFEEKGVNNFRYAFTVQRFQFTARLISGMSWNVRCLEFHHCEKVSLDYYSGVEEF